MAVPLVALAIPAAAAGFLGGPFAAALGRAHSFHLGLAGATGSALALVGLAIGYVVFRRGDRAFAATLPFDRVYELIYARGLVVVSTAAAWFDRYIVDGLVNAVGALCLGAGARLRRVQTGNVQDYLLAVAAGAIALVAWGVFR
jgi:NADH-quinone oxidoreductase subunit L